MNWSTGDRTSTWNFEMDFYFGAEIELRQTSNQMISSNEKRNYLRGFHMSKKLKWVKWVYEPPVWDMKSLCLSWDNFTNK